MENKNGCSSAVLLRNTLRSPKAGTSTIVLTRQAVPFAGWHRCRSWPWLGPQVPQRCTVDSRLDSEYIGTILDWTTPSHTQRGLFSHRAGDSNSAASNERPLRFLNSLSLKPKIRALEDAVTSLGS